MKIYIDFDDVLCETAEYFTKIAKELFGIDVPAELESELPVCKFKF